MSKSLLGIGATLLASLAFAAVATADSEKDTKIIMNGEPTFHGIIESTAKDCVEGRTVKVLRKRREGRDKLIGATTTDADGYWSVPVQVVKAGVYYAKVRRVTLESGIFCGGDRSNKLSFG